MIDPKQDRIIRFQITALINWAIGCFIIFVIGCVTYFYLGPIAGIEGEVGFQVTGLLVAGIIAHYSYRTFGLIREHVVKIREDDDDDDVQE